MAKTIIEPDELARPIGPFSSAVMKGSFVFVSGTVGRDREGKIVGEGDVAVQTRKTLENIKTLLEEAGATMEDVVKVTVFLKDVKDYRGMNEV